MLWTGDCSHVECLHATASQKPRAGCHSGSSMHLHDQSHIFNSHIKMAELCACHQDFGDSHKHRCIVTTPKSTAVLAILAASSWIPDRRIVPSCSPQFGQRGDTAHFQVVAGPIGTHRLPRIACQDTPCRGRYCCLMLRLHGPCGLFGGTGDGSTMSRLCLLTNMLQKRLAGLNHMKRDCNVCDESRRAASSG